jgi:hypothetical protein
MRYRVFMVFMVAFATMVACNYARSQLVPLACAGKMTARTRHVTKDYNIALTIDLNAKTATVGSYGKAPIVGGVEGDILVFMTEKRGTYGISIGIINRITGVTRIHIITLTDGLYLFYGVCKPVQKLLASQNNVDHPQALIIAR